MIKAHKFNDWSEAFDFCREGNVPMIAVVEGKALKCYPSGHGVSVPIEKCKIVKDWTINNE